MHGVIRRSQSESLEMSIKLLSWICQSTVAGCCNAHNPNTICICMYSKIWCSQLVQHILLLSFLTVAVVQCQDCGGLGSFHDIRKTLARSFFGGPLLGMGIFFRCWPAWYKLFPWLRCASDSANSLPHHPKLKPQRSSNINPSKSKLPTLHSDNTLRRA